ncbi:MAG: GGDEF domain-containing protein, partial [Armatimonadota bacterium]
VDRLKGVNDTFGHAAGDIVLAQVADILVEQVRSDDTVMRIGGDEFLVIMPDTTVSDIRGVQKRLQSVLRQTLRRLAREGKLAPEIAELVGLSGGLAEYRAGDDNTFEETLQIADRRMYAQKDQKKMGRDYRNGFLSADESN